MYFTYNDIIKDNNPIMRQKSEEVKIPLTKIDKALASALLTYVIDSQDEVKAEEQQLRAAVGISAIQVGVPKKILAIVLNNEEDEKTVLLLANPKIISESVQKCYLKLGEGCLSVESEHAGYVPRSARIRIVGFDIQTNQNIELSLAEYPAIVMQHELDHFNGILFYDHINHNNPWFEYDDAIIID